ncbi:MAG: hypothetical protein ACYC28_03980 [Longimicrobiales bacterium]
MRYRIDGRGRGSHERAERQERREFRLPLFLVALALTLSCARSTEERRALFEEAERVNAEIFRGAVVRDLRSPPDSGRLIYDDPVSLRARDAQGAAQVWAPFGIAQPDTTR